MRGFTLIEILVTVAIISILSLASYPYIMNTLETRSLENGAREILTVLQTSRYRAIDTKDNHRVRFYQDGTNWRMIIERETSAGNWEPSRGFAPRTISPKFNVTVRLPAGESVVFSSLGVVENFVSTANSLELQSDRLKGQNQPDLRIVRFYSGGSVHYIKTTS
ncbi:MAG: prepilin-type N-terminal cleavage/methylation domain-containing protein [Acidobacteriota bacterium]|nr:prepilin-type N-terminal cleavage/methylation domain-containing protein [Acidobacteriota bacterium]